MRRALIQNVLPLAFCVLPVLAGALVALAIPPAAMSFYLKRLEYSPMDWLILGLGAALFLAQMVLGFRALRWRDTGFDERPDKWLSNLAQGAEWFPLLGLLGTVGGILQTFSAMGGEVTPHEIIVKYAPAITATGSGLFMALLNIVPTWLVNVGRDLIMTLSGHEPANTPGG
ncbi:MAG: MotA/TolQ/ExbB proton channel family protein [Gemmataceae bacterium]